MKSRERTHNTQQQHDKERASGARQHAIASPWAKYGIFYRFVYTRESCSARYDSTLGQFSHEHVLQHMREPFPLGLMQRLNINTDTVRVPGGL
ncbi:hypothetical protein E2C01_098189 [Portunus trituberculatus]|uniref:Uncharacterized protein n=1 Tax=Portunus trituberculatus TaxID=210409 RepID=A0A5B7K704_PORTR|nr:hypothetical protein [Portunus trituberculatus]